MPSSQIRLRKEVVWYSYCAHSVVPRMASLQLLWLQISYWVHYGLVNSDIWLHLIGLCFTYILQLFLPSLMLWSSRTGVNIYLQCSSIRLRIGQVWGWAPLNRFKPPVAILLLTVPRQLSYFLIYFMSVICVFVYLPCVCFFVILWGVYV